MEEMTMNRNQIDDRWRQCYWPQWGQIKKRWSEIRKTQGQPMNEKFKGKPEPGVTSESQAPRIQSEAPELHGFEHEKVEKKHSRKL